MGRKPAIGPATRHIAAELRAQRARLGLTIDQVTDTTGLARSTVVYCLKGEQSITIEAYLALCEALGIDAGPLLDEAAELAATHPDALALAADRTSQPTDRERFEAQHEHDDPA